MKFLLSADLTWNYSGEIKLKLSWDESTIIIEGCRDTFKWHEPQALGLDFVVSW